MAVFLINICKFNGCGITFPSLGDLIQHIEDTHIDYDPQVIEQKELARPACLPLSYVLRFITDAARKEGPFLGTSGAELKRKIAIKHHSYSLTSSNRSNTPTDLGSEMDEDEMLVSESEDSNDSWTTEEFSSEFIMRYGSRHSGSVGSSSSNEKPFACPVPGCKKRYKNVNGIKYHSKNGHKKDGKVRKGYKCPCGKSYKTSQGLKSHSSVAHNTIGSNGSNGGGGGSGGGGSGGTNTVGGVNNANNNNSSNVIGLTGNNNGTVNGISFVSSGSGLISSDSSTLIINSNNNNNNNNNTNNIISNNNNGNIIAGSLLTSPAQSGSLSPSSASNISGGGSSSNSSASSHSINQSQLSPNSTNSISLSSSSLSLTSPNQQQQQIQQNIITNNIGGVVGGSGGVVGGVVGGGNTIATSNHSMKGNFGLISVKPKQSGVHHHIGSGTINTNNHQQSIIHTNNNKLMNGNISGNNNNNTTLNNVDLNTVKMTLPNLVNLGIITPATSPKLQQQQQQHHHNHQYVQHNNNNNNSNNNSNNNNNQPNQTVHPNGSTDCLPLTPISPNMSKNVNFINSNNNNNINNNRNNNNAGADNITADET